MPILAGDKYFSIHLALIERNFFIFRQKMNELDLDIKHLIPVPTFSYK